MFQSVYSANFSDPSDDEDTAKFKEDHVEVQVEVEGAENGEETAFEIEYADKSKETEIEGLHEMFQIERLQLQTSLA